jgi:nitrogen fixation protein FixH
MARGWRRSGGRDYLALASVAFVGVFVLAFVAFSVIALVVQREHVAYERANRKCETSAPRGATGWNLDWNGDTETFTCTFGRNGRPTGQVLRVRRSDL